MRHLLQLDTEEAHSDGTPIRRLGKQVLTTYIINILTLGLARENILIFEAVQDQFLELSHALLNCFNPAFG